MVVTDDEGLARADRAGFGATARPDLTGTRRSGETFASTSYRRPCCA